MNERYVIAVLIWLLTGGARSQDAGAPDGFVSGREFANGKFGKPAAVSSVNKENAFAHVPKFNLAPPEAEVYGGGKAFIGAKGLGKQVECSVHVAGSAYAQQECDAVNYLSRGANRGPRYVIERKADPLLLGSRETIDHPGSAGSGGGPACYLVTTTTPGTHTEERCERSASVDTIPCYKTLVPACGHKAAPLSGYLASRTGAFVTARMTASASAGLYDFLLEVPYRNCGGNGAAQLDFKLDTVGEGGYITLQIGNLDDTAAVAVNGTTLFAGYPNAGPHHAGEVFPSTRADFQLEYSWDEDVGGEVCVKSDSGGKCVEMAHRPLMRTFRADTKLLNSCPVGYAARTQSATGDADTSVTSPGFFCNAEHKLLMNRHEGLGTWSGSVASSIPLRVGANQVSVFWGTARAGGSCGNVRVSGQVYNVAPGCGTSWDDQCAPMRAAVGK